MDMVSQFNRGCAIIAVMKGSGGLSSREARRRLVEYGHNNISDTKKLSGAAAFLARFRNPLVVILLMAAILSFFMNEVASGAIILGIVLISTTLDFLNTYRSEKAAAALQKSVCVTAKVLRDRKVKSIALSDIVPGDVIELTAGSLIPADGKVIITTDLSVDESALTGESYPVLKAVDDVVYMGSNVSSGSGRMLVTTTGKATEFAHVAASINRNQPTEFDIEIAKLSSMLARITCGLVVFILAVNIAFHRDAMSSLLFGIALAVGMTPELLPLIITINLTKGSLRMAKKGVIVKKLSSMQNFGSMDILCTDKTGTLTENKISVARTQDYNRTESQRTLTLAAVACKFSTSYESPLDLAVLNFQKYNLSVYRKKQEIPFDFQRKRESVVAHTESGNLLITKGAADTMLDIVKHYRDQNGVVRRLSPAGLEHLRGDYTALSQEGYRVLMIASKVVPDDGHYTPADEQSMTFEGYIAFIDPPKSTAAKSLRNLQANNIEIKIITGDDPLVSQKVASELGLNIKGVLTGDQIKKLNHIQLERRAEKTTIFARVNPSQKLAVIEALRRRGHVVGYIGDGINDAPSLRAADIGISVNNAVDVAKDTADMILLGKSLGYLNDGVVEGRRTFANTMKYLQMSLSSNFGNMFSMAGASLFLPFLPMTAPQILFNNILYDTSQFAIPTDNVDPDQLNQPRRMNIRSLKRYMWTFGVVSSVFDFITFGVLMLIFNTTAAEFQTGWFIESLLTQTLVVFVIRTRKLPIINSRPSGVLTASVLAVLTVAMATIFSSVGRYFGFAAPSLGIAIAVGLIVFAYLLVVEGVKHLFYRRVNL